MDVAVDNDAAFLPHHDRLVSGRVALRLHGGLLRDLERRAARYTC
jgi:hypothetical protein